MDALVAYTVTASLRLTTFGADPEIGRAGIHKELEVARRVTNLDGRDVTNIVSPARRRKYISIFDSNIFQLILTHSMSSPREFCVLGWLA